MSTDDLIRRARARAAVQWPMTETSAIVSALSAEVDRLRAERDAARAEADRFRTLWDRHGKNDLLAERDAARAALGRVRAVADQWDTLAEGYSNMFGNQVSISAAVAAERTYNALEGES